MKLESQVIINHYVLVKLFLDLAHTARHMPELSFVRSRKIQDVDSIFPYSCKAYLLNTALPKFEDEFRV